ncbi:MAG: Hpt domain-containing protein [Planctomycetales bacterium]|nr:Hpt domain-containing protein [Planctomycetales bacterium]
MSSLEPAIEQNAIQTDELLARCMNRVALMERILDHFITNATNDIAPLLAAVGEVDRDKIASYSHKLKGTSLTVAAKPLAVLASQLQDQAAEASEIELEALVNQLQAEFQRAQCFVTNMQRSSN